MTFLVILSIATEGTDFIFILNCRRIQICNPKDARNFPTEKEVSDRERRYGQEEQACSVYHYEDSDMAWNTPIMS